jgi:hypothetical protein
MKTNEIEDLCFENVPKAVLVVDTHRYCPYPNHTRRMQEALLRAGDAAQGRLRSVAV